jgi:hypothetical protein
MILIVFPTLLLPRGLPLECRRWMILIFYLDLFPSMFKLWFSFIEIDFHSIQVRIYSYSFKLRFRYCLGRKLWGFQLNLRVCYVSWLSFIFKIPNSNLLQPIFVSNSNRLESLHNILFSVPVRIKIFLIVHYAPCQAPINNHRSFALSIAFRSICYSSSLFL